MKPRNATVVALLSSLVLAACFSDNDVSDSDIAVVDPMVIAGGGTTGIYYSYGAELADALSKHFSVDASVQETGGSIENLQNLQSGESQLAFSAADAAADATAGTGLFDEAVPLQAIGRVYDDFVHLIVPRDSDIETINDLPGHAVSLGAEGSGTELIARRMLEIAELGATSMSVHGYGIDRSIEALRAGEIDAFFWSGGLPTPGIDELSTEMPIRLVSLTDLVEAARDAYGGGYRHGVVPEGTYDLPADVPTMAVPNFLMVRQDLPDDVAYAIIKVLFEQRSHIAEDVPAAALLDLPRAVFTEPVDLHPGAVRYYRDAKI